MEVAAPVSTSQPASTTSPQPTPDSKPVNTKMPPPTPQSLEKMKKEAHLKFEEAAKTKKEAEAIKAEAEKISQQALQSKAQVEEFINLVKTRPRALERMYGKDVAKKIAEDLLYEFFEEEKLSPEQLNEKQRRAAEAAELETYRKEKKERDENNKKTEHEKAVNEQVQHIDGMIAKAMKDYNLPMTPSAIKRVAEYLDAQLSSKLELDPTGIVPKVHEEHHMIARDYFKSMPIEDFYEEFPTIVKAIREFDMKKNPDLPTFQTGFSKPKTEEEAKQASKKKDFDEFFKRIDKQA